MSRQPDVARLADGVRSGDRAALARAITLVESRKAAHRSDAADLLDRLLPASGGAVRVGITGVPGVGKSTLIDRLGSTLVKRGRRVAVLAVDPSSARTGGSILGDKTRMAKLGRDERAYIRPSPTAGTLGGVAARTREAMVVCEAAGYDVVIVETVGIGQSETAVADMVDVFVALMLPGAGDELQGLKKGIVEIADIIAINKADGGTRRSAEAAAATYRAALHVMAPTAGGWTTPVQLVSGLEGTGLEDLWASVERCRQTQEASGRLDVRRAEQNVRWLWTLVETRLHEGLTDDETDREAVADIENAVRRGKITATAGAEQVARLFRSKATESRPGKSRGGSKGNGTA